MPGKGLTGPPKKVVFGGTKTAYLFFENAFAFLRKSISRRPVPRGENSMVASQ
jgi:hypothetical protein